MRNSIAVTVTRGAGIAVVLLVAGCTWGRLEGVPLSTERLSKSMMEFADGLESEWRSSTGKNLLNYSAIPYITKEGQAADCFADRFTCFLLYLEVEEFGKYEKGYGLFEAEGLYPIVMGGGRYVFDEKGARRYVSRAGFFGVFFPYPVFRLAGIDTTVESCDATGATYRDYGITILELPGVETSLLKIGTNALDILFLPLWRADDSPRMPPQPEAAPAGA